MNFTLEEAKWGKSIRPNGSFPEDNVQMYITSIHNNNPVDMLKNERLHCRQLFDEFELNNYLSYAQVPSNEASEITNRAFSEIVKAHVTNAGFELALSDECLPDLYDFSGSAALIKEGLEDYLNECKKDQYWASGDDSFFDYTPDLVYVIYQICCVLKFEDFWRRFLTWAVETWYMHEDDDPLDVDDETRKLILNN